MRPRGAASCTPPGDRPGCALVSAKSHLGCCDEPFEDVLCRSQQGQKVEGSMVRRGSTAWSEEGGRHEWGGSHNKWISEEGHVQSKCAVSVHAGCTRRRAPSPRIILAAHSTRQHVSTCHRACVTQHMSPVCAHVTCMCTCPPDTAQPAIGSYKPALRPWVLLHRCQAQLRGETDP